MKKVLRFPARSNSLYANVILWIILPLTTVLLGITLLSTLIYQNIINQLIYERHSHLANVAAASVSQVIEGYAHVLEAYGGRSGSQGSVLLRSEAALEAFTAGVIIVDQDGKIVHTTSDILSAAGLEILNTGFQNPLHTIRAPAFSNVISIPERGVSLVLVAAPLRDEEGDVSGAILGALDLDKAPFDSIVQKLSEPSAGYVYLLDSQGIVISHPQPEEIGRNYQDQLPLPDGENERNQNTLWKSPTSEYFITATADVSATGWRLVVKEPWEDVIFMPRFYSLVIFTSSLLAALVVSLLSLKSTKQVTNPIQMLVSQTERLSAGDQPEPIEKSGIDEVDQLAAAYEEMVRQIVSYRNGLRRYVGAITSSQEEERLRIARELHDEIIQNLLTISRKIELCQLSGDVQEQERLLSQLKEMTLQTTQEVRQISQDLRPMMLDDLGLVPAIQMLVQSVHEGRGAVPHANFKVLGQVEPLAPMQELALYRIAQESLSNVRKHARATGVMVELTFNNREVCLSVQDDGAGFEVPSTMTELVQQGSLGLMGIQERVWSVEGQLSIESTPGIGSKIFVTIPLILEESEA